MQIRALVPTDSGGVSNVTEMCGADVHLFIVPGWVDSGAWQLSDVNVRPTSQNGPSALHPSESLAVITFCPYLFA